MNLTFFSWCLAAQMIFALINVEVLPQKQKRHPCRYLIPAEYVGWVRIDYGISGAPALPVEDGYRICRFPSSGHLQTSSAYERASYADLSSGQKDQFYYYTGNSLRSLPAGPDGVDEGMIWRRTHTEGGAGEIKASPSEPRIGDKDHKSQGIREGTVKNESFEFFFVGTEEAFRKYGEGSLDPFIGPQTGPINKRAG
jgi:hypothetical protein